MFVADGHPYLIMLTVIHQLMIHHHPMIHFCYVNNFLKNNSFFMKQFSSRAQYFVYLWLNFEKDWMSFRHGTSCSKVGFYGICWKMSHHPMIHLCFGNFSMVTSPNLLKFGGHKLVELWKFNMYLLWWKNIFLNWILILKFQCIISWWMTVYEVCELPRPRTVSENLYVIFGLESLLTLT